MATVYLNAYHTTLAYGGPEEGGWWYTEGEPIASVPADGEYKELDPGDDVTRVPVISEDKLAAFAEEMRSRFGYLLEQRFPRDKDDIVVRVEDKFAEPYPQHQPRYS